MGCYAEVSSIYSHWLISIESQNEFFKKYCKSHDLYVPTNDE